MQSRMLNLITSASLLGWLLIPEYTGALSGANSLIPGSYRCTAYNISGGGGSCRNMQPLVINPDGTYRYSSTRGQWSIQNGKLVLSESKLWGKGELVGRDSIRFSYAYRGWQHVVTWSCQECGNSDTKPLTHSPTSGGSLIGVSLTLEFDQNIGGVSGFVIIPADHARSYTHNAPLPKGAVQGLAWETSATAVALATNKNNKLISGKRYVVFLSWPRETLPVAILELPAAHKDYSARLRAALNEVPEMQ